MTTTNEGATPTNDNEEVQTTTPETTPTPAQHDHHENKVTGDESTPTTTTGGKVTGDNNDESDDNEERTFSEKYVKELREESKKHRLRSKDRDELASSLADALVKIDGRLAPGAVDIPDDIRSHPTPEKVEEWVTGVISANPRLSSRAPAADVGLGDRGSAGTSLIDILKGV